MSLKWATLHKAHCNFSSVDVKIDENGMVQSIIIIKVCEGNVTGGNKGGVQLVDIQFDIVVFSLTVTTGCQQKVQCF